MRSARGIGAVLLLSLLQGAAAQQEQKQSPVGEIFASDASVRGSLQFVAGGMQVMSGSSVVAGDSAALLRLLRGGEVRVCPRTSVSIASSQNDRDLMFGISSGGLETHYTLAASADSIITPDFRIQLAGPGTFHIAIGTDARGNTCVRPLPNNTASLIVTELMGDGVYQLKPGEARVFHNGRVTDPEGLTYECGCPAPPPPVMRAAAPPPPPPAAEPAPAPKPEPPPPNPLHVEVDAPFIFRAAEPLPSPVEPAVRLSSAVAPQFPLVALPPALAAPKAPAVVAQQKPPSKPKKKGLFGRVGSFFASLFH